MTRLLLSTLLCGEWKEAGPAGLPWTVAHVVYAPGCLTEEQMEAEIQPDHFLSSLKSRIWDVST